MTSSMATWQPILSGADRERTLATVRAIADLLAELPRDRADARAASESAALALFFTYAAEALDEDRYAERAMSFLDHAIECATTTPSSLALHGGFTGVAWTIEHLSGRLFEPESDDLNEATDSRLLALLSQSPWSGSYDLISGLVGIGVYSLERIQRPTGRACLERVIARLAELAEEGPDRATWFTAPERLPEWQREQYPQGVYDLGVAHGVPGAVALLAGAVQANVETATAARLLDGAVAWLLARRQSAANTSLFASMLPPTGATENSRSAWCYGDPGVGSALLLSGRLAGQADWVQTAIEILAHAAARDPSDTRVVDAGLCHGSAGLALLFARAHQATGDSTFCSSASYWFLRTLELLRRDEDNASDWIPGIGRNGTIPADHSLLTGVVGTGLALLAGATGTPPEWDRLLLLSVAS